MPCPPTRLWPCRVRSTTPRRHRPQAAGTEAWQLRHWPMWIPRSRRCAAPQRSASKASFCPPGACAIRRRRTRWPRGVDAARAAPVARVCSIRVGCLKAEGATTGWGDVACTAIWAWSLSTRSGLRCSPCARRAGWRHSLARHRAVCQRRRQFPGGPGALSAHGRRRRAVFVATCRAASAGHRGHRFARSGWHPRIASAARQRTVVVLGTDTPIFDLARAADDWRLAHL